MASDPQEIRGDGVAKAYHLSPAPKGPKQQSRSRDQDVHKVIEGWRTHRFVRAPIVDVASPASSCASAADAAGTCAMGGAIIGSETVPRA